MPPDATPAGLPTVRALRILSSERRGSSWPVLAETSGGPQLVKLRGAGQGTGPLVAEVIVGALAPALGLRVPERSLVEIDQPLRPPEPDYELSALLNQSLGINLGFRYLRHARLLEATEVERVDADTAAAIVWLDALVMNPDRTARNSNLLWSEGRLWLIDHGAALGFQYAWPSVVESAPRRPSPQLESHLLLARAGDLGGWDELLAPRLTRAVLETAVAEVPDAFLEPLLPSATAVAEAIRRRRAAYVAYLWKRLQPPRDFFRLEARGAGGAGQ